MTWSPQQDAALKAISDWHRDSDDQVFYLGGYAGTGKTTLAKAIAEDVTGAALFAAFTGKAALVLHTKGCTGAQTIHSLIYKAFEDEERHPDTGDVLKVTWRYALDKLSVVSTASLVIVDECSMVDARLGEDLLSYGTKLLVLGDPAQLPPVRGAGFFTSVPPDFMLTEIHRQAADNPIIRMSMDVRDGRSLQRGSYGESRVVSGRLGRDMVLGAEQVLCGRNVSRRTINARVRFHQGRNPEAPETGDRLVCLRNNKDKGLLNGGLWTVDTVKVAEDGFREGCTSLKVASNDVRGMSADIVVPDAFFTGREEDVPYEARHGRDEFTYGYALTVHKAQGSQWNDVLLIDESSTFREHRSRHLYTGLTRAAERVTVVVP